MKTNIITCIIIIAAAAFFGWRVIDSPAPLWLKAVCGIAFGVVILAMLDAIIAVTGERGRK